MPDLLDPDIYRDILDGLQIGVSVLDLGQRIIFWSDGAASITGYSRMDVLGHSCTENILPRCNQNTCEMCEGDCPLSQAAREAKPLESIASIHHKSGHWTPVHSWAIPLRDKRGSIIGIIRTFESEFSVNGPNPNDRSMKERGCLDQTTELPNQAMMQSHLREALAIFAELEIPLGVLCLEVEAMDSFRARYGTEAAAISLRALARTLRNSVWPTDFVGRWSENRFLVILCGCDGEALHTVRARILRIMAKVTIHWWGVELSVGVLLGSANALAGDGVESLLRRMNASLEEGRGVVVEHSAAAAAGSPSSAESTTTGSSSNRPSPDRPSSSRPSSDRSAS
jgi:diguanylate cyclase (GGDEF)-like protein/PAS domain S-box-containing protein